MTSDIFVRAMTAADLAEATRVYRLAFGTFLKAPDPTQFRLDIGTVSTRFAADPAAALVVERDGRVIGSALGMDWGSQFVVGPITVDPAHWGQGVARRLSAAILDVAAARKPALVSLFTHPASTTHLRLYESFGFAPMYLTPVMSKLAATAASAQRLRIFSSLAAGEQKSLLEQSRALAAACFPGLDLSREIRAIDAHRLGETVLIDDADGLSAFALCHLGAGTEAGDGALFVKFAAVRPGAVAEFERLLDAIEVLAAERGVARIAAGINTARRDAYRRMLARGFRASLVGVAMQRPDLAGTLRPDLYIIDDWR